MSPTLTSFAAVAGVAVLFASVLFIVWFYLFLDRPLRELIRLMAEAPRKKFLVRADVKRHGVIGRLAQGFNTLLERITTLDASRIESHRELTLLRELQTRLKEISLLHEFSMKVSSSLELDELCNIVEQFLGNTLGFEEFAFLVFDETAQRLEVKAAHGFPDSGKIYDMTFRPGEGITGHALQTGELIYLSDTRKDAGYLHYKGERREDGSFLSIPLVFKKKVVGILNMFRPGVDRFSEGEIRFLSTLSAGLAVGLVNALLYSKTRELSVRDELTQAHNRRHFQETLPLEIKRAQRFGKPLTVVMMDIDFFKRFNDQFGHLAGDACLKEVAHVVSSKVREVDFFARFGGEEFVLLLPNTSKEDGFRVAEKIRLLVKGHSFLIGNTSASLTVSMGVASYPDDGKSPEDLIDAADVALYEAKRTGRNNVTPSKPSLPSSDPSSESREITALPRAPICKS